MEFFSMITILPVIFGLIIFFVCIFPVIAIVLGLGSIRGKGSLLGVFLGFVVSFTLFRILISLLVKISEISLDTLQNIGISFLILIGIMMIFPQYSLWHKVEGGFKKGVIYSALLGFLSSFWIGLSKDVFADYYEPKWIGVVEIYITFISSLLPAIFLSFLSYILSKLYPSAYIDSINRILGFLTLGVALLLALHLIVVPIPREGLKPYEPPPKTLKEIFNLK